MAEEKLYPWKEKDRAIRRGKPWVWIGLPAVIGLLLVVGVIAATLTTGFGTLRVWADVSLVLVLLPLCMLGILPLIVLIILSYGVVKFVGWLPDPLHQVDRILARAAMEARRGSNLVTKPILVLQGSIMTVKTFLRGLAKMLR